MCTFAEAFLCRSFDFFTQTNACFLYNANLKDSLSPNVFGIANTACEHYSSNLKKFNLKKLEELFFIYFFYFKGVYLTENGITQTLNPNKSNTKTKYEGGE